MKRWVGLVAAIALVQGCAAALRFDDGDLDTGLHPEVSVPLSLARPRPTAAEKARPVVIVTHGFSATVWDQQPLIDGLEARGIQTSGVTLGGHGRSYEALATTDWHAWAAPLAEEFKALRRQGYRHVSIMGHSTGATLWLESIAEGRLGGTPEASVFVSPLIEFATFPRGIYYAGLGPYIGVNAVGRKVLGTSVGHLYHYRAVSALQTLSEVTKRVRHRLEWGLPMSAASRVLVVQGDNDDVVDASGAQLLARGLVGPTPRLMMVHSGLHNPIGPDGMQGHTFSADEAALRSRLIGAIGDHLLAASAR